VALKTKNSNLRQLASSSGFTALLGITEPALYGVLLKFRRVLIAAMIGGGCAGVYAGVSGLVRYAFVSPGLAALPAFIGENPMNIVHALVTCAISIVVTFTLTWFIAFKDVPEARRGERGAAACGQPDKRWGRRKSSARCAARWWRSATSTTTSFPAACWARGWRFVPKKGYCARRLAAR
jgi:phosphotransferase system  glucose/maltose/N-acetylglucosamine-specific IIC component